MSWVLLPVLSSTGSSALLSTISLLAWVLLPPILAFVSFVAFGGVQRNALAQFSAGLLLLIVGSSILAAWAASDARRSEDVLGAAILVGLFPWLGSSMLLLSLVGFGVNGWLTDSLWIVNLVGLFFLQFVYWARAPYGGVPFLLYALVVTVVAGLLLLLHRRRDALLKGFLLGVGGAVVVLVVYGFGREDILLTPNTFVPPENSLAASSGLALFLGVALFFVARFWSRPTPIL